MPKTTRKRSARVRAGQLWKVRDPREFRFVRVLKTGGGTVLVENVDTLRRTRMQVATLTRCYELSRDA